MINVAKYSKISSLFIPRESENPKEYFNYLNETIREKAYNSFNEASKVIFVANETKNLWSGLYPNNSFKVIHNSLNTSILNEDSIYSRFEIRQSYGISEDEIVLLSLGTVTERKGQIDFIKSLPLVYQKTNKKIRTIVVGINFKSLQDEKSYSCELYKLIEDMPDKIKESLILVPETDSQLFTKAYDFFSISDIFIFTSRIESFPRVILEAMYFNLPIITTPCFGVKEQCVEGYNSLYYNYFDYSDLSEKILNIVNDDILRKIYSENSKILFQNLQTYEQMITNYYVEILNLNDRRV